MHRGTSFEILTRKILFKGYFYACEELAGSHIQHSCELSKVHGTMFRVFKPIPLPPTPAFVVVTTCCYMIYHILIAALMSSIYEILIYTRYNNNVKGFYINVLLVSSYMAISEHKSVLLKKASKCFGIVYYRLFGGWLLTTA